MIYYKSGVLLLGHSELDEVLAFLAAPDVGPAELYSYQLKSVSPQLMWELPKQIERFAQAADRLMLLIMPVNDLLLWQTKAKVLLRP